jgi:hypothetical protein
MPIRCNVSYIQSFAIFAPSSRRYHMARDFCFLTLLGQMSGSVSIRGSSWPAKLNSLLLAPYFVPNHGSQRQQRDWQALQFLRVPMISVRSFRLITWKTCFRGPASMTRVCGKLCTAPTDLKDSCDEEGNVLPDWDRPFLSQYSVGFVAFTAFVGGSSGPRVVRLNHAYRN